ncbi:pyruvate, phosphate dikinase [bacterium Unc6]|nr:pyruvate, phosphate dikinase [bacterium Unc6]
MAKYVYFFGNGKAEGRKDMKSLLGGKGANLAEMTHIGVPVPPGFTITTEVCNLYFTSNGKLPSDVDIEMEQNLKKLEEVSSYKFASIDNPLLVSVRSGAKFSMPGMMDTILNLGLNDKTVLGLVKKTNNERFAWDCYRRFVQMFGNVVLDIDKNVFETILHGKKEKKNITSDTELNAQDLKGLVEEYKKKLKELGKTFPQDAMEQLKMARGAVFKSWDNERAVFYRKQYKIPHNIGTAVNVQMMVFGNMGETSATGVGFTRDPSTGQKEFFGEFLTNAQGEDVVAGIRTPRNISEMKALMPDVYNQLIEITQKLEKHYRDVQDFEFTVQENRLYMLQTRNGKRTGAAAIKIAVEMVHEGLITKEEAVLRVEPEQLDQLLHPRIDVKAKPKVIAKGLNASPGAAVGKVYFTAEDAVNAAKSGEKVLLVRNETCPDDIEGVARSQGVLTATGGATSHAVIVSRQMGKPCVAGCSAVRINEKQGTMAIGNIKIKKGDYVAIDGSTGEVMLGNVPTIKPDIKELAKSEYGELIQWADQIRKLEVRANADIPRDAIIARANGAEGIGLCRTEHMFFAPERLPLMQEMILAKDESSRKMSLQKLLPMQREDFIELFETMKGFPVTIRLLDPPLHEFLPKREEIITSLAELKCGKDVTPETIRNLKTQLRVDKIIKIPDTDIEGNIKQLEALLHRVEELHEFNPMLGLRGCRLGIVMPEITQMQAQAIFEAAAAVIKSGSSVHPEVMVPLVGHVQEFIHQKAIITKAAEEVMKEHQIKIEYLIGTMIEVPRAALTSDAIAKEAEFFSFGTNDLTQMTFGFSRDDSGKFLPYYIGQGILTSDPFVSLDQTGVGQLVKMGVSKGRSVRPTLKCGICGEHGGEGSSVEFCHRAGLDYVSCSPYRVPLARLAAAHGVLKEKKEQ